MQKAKTKTWTSFLANLLLVKVLLHNNCEKPLAVYCNIEQLGKYVNIVCSSDGGWRKGTTNLEKKKRKNPEVLDWIERNQFGLKDLEKKSFPSFVDLVQKQWYECICVLLGF